MNNAGRLRATKRRSGFETDRTPRGLTRLLREIMHFMPNLLIFGSGTLVVAGLPAGRQLGR
jgi:hypothetical protein